VQELKEIIRQTSNVVLVFENLPLGTNEEQAAEHIWGLCGLNIDPRYISTKDRTSGDYSTAMAVLHRDTLADYFGSLLKDKGIRVKSWDFKKPNAANFRK
jgi:hypothetical protein